MNLGFKAFVKAENRAAASKPISRSLVQGMNLDDDGISGMGFRGCDEKGGIWERAGVEEERAREARREKFC